MEEDPQPPGSAAATGPGTGKHSDLHSPVTDSVGEKTAGQLTPSDDLFYVDSNCSTPYVSAPSSPGRFFDGGGGGGGGGGYFYSAPASPMHFILSTSLMSSEFTPSPSEVPEAGISGCGSFEFDFSSKLGTSCNESAVEIGSMTSADELFLNGQIRPMKLSTHLQRPQVFAPLMDLAESDDNGQSGGKMREVKEKDSDRDGKDVFERSRDLRLRSKSLRRRTRSLSPLRNAAPFDWCEMLVRGEDEEDRPGLQVKTTSEAHENGDDDVHDKCAEEETISNSTTPSASASSSRCSSAGRSSKRWVFLTDFLRSKSEGRTNHKFWTNISFSPAKEKKSSLSQAACNSKEKAKESDSPPDTQKPPKKFGKKAAKNHQPPAGKPANGVGKRRVPLSAHELHYTANRAQAEEMRKKTFLPYRQGLLGCLGFSSKSYGAMNGFARTLNPVSSR